MRLQIISDPHEACATCSRRTLLHGLGVAVVGSIVGCGGGGNADIDAPASVDAPAVCPPKDLCLDVTMAKYSALANPGGSVVVQTATDTIIVVRKSATAVAAVSAICTHQGCQTTYQAGTMLLFCPCHGAEFSLTGSVVRGPASVPVKAYTATVSGTIVTVVVA